MSTSVTKSINIQNTAPTASFTVTPTSGSIETVFILNASASSDNEDSKSDLLVRWDGGNNGTWDTDYRTTKFVSLQYSTVGTKTIKLEVKDTGGLTNTTTRSFIVTDHNIVTDIDGNTYRTVEIGNQVWMAENLKVEHYQNGDPIANLSESIADGYDWTNATYGAYCNYKKDSQYIGTYGYLYNWYAVNDSRGLAPEGWHVPSDEEWKQLEIYLGMNQSSADGKYWRGNIGGKLKEAGTSHWYSPNRDATNASGFTALPGGWRSSNAFFDGKGYYAFFWTSTRNWEGSWFRRLDYNSTSVERLPYDNHSLRVGGNIRCVKD